MKTNGTTLHVRVGGQGPAVVMLHGFADTGDMWTPAAAELARNHTVIVPDLRGMGLSAHPDAGYTKKSQALDIVGKKDGVSMLDLAGVVADSGKVSPDYAALITLAKDVVQVTNVIDEIQLQSGQGWQTATIDLGNFDVVGNQAQNSGVEKRRSHGSIT